MMDSKHIEALETRARWLRWAYDHLEESGSIGIPRDSLESWKNAMPHYVHALHQGDTFFMNGKFADLVDHARRSVPDDLAFEESWLQSPAGFMYIDEPFLVPRLALSNEVALRMLNDRQKTLSAAELEALIGRARMEMRVSAIAWAPCEDKERGTHGTEFFCFVKQQEGFIPWSYFGVSEGEKLIERIRQFEARAGMGSYFESEQWRDPEGKELVRMEELHEIRWIYAACYLMAQKLAMQVTHHTDRHTRRRAERQRMAVTPLLRVITLRRLEEARKTEGHAAVDWQWQWEVRGHWRNQYFPSPDEHKPVFIEAYIKGPDTKPLKPTSHRLFLASR